MGRLEQFSNFGFRASATTHQLSKIPRCCFQRVYDKRMALRSPFLNLQFFIIATDMAESSSASEIRIPNAARATKTKLEMVWMQVEQSSVLWLQVIGLALTVS